MMPRLEAAALVAAVGIDPAGTLFVAGRFFVPDDLRSLLAGFAFDLIVAIWLSLGSTAVSCAATDTSPVINWGERPRVPKRGAVTSVNTARITLRWLPMSSEFGAIFWLLIEPRDHKSAQEIKVYFRSRRENSTGSSLCRLRLSFPGANSGLVRDRKRTGSSARWRSNPLTTACRVRDQLSHSWCWKTGRQR